MATADMISSFLSNEMSPAQERQFLLSVAASDSLRLELKSHVMLDRIISGRVQRAQVPDSVRSVILAEAGVAIAGVQPKAQLPRVPAPGPVAGLRAAVVSRLVARASVIAVALTGFATGYFAGTFTDLPSAAQQVQMATPVDPDLNTQSLPAGVSSQSARDENAEPGVATTSATPSIGTPLKRDVVSATRNGTGNVVLPSRQSDRVVSVPPRAAPASGGAIQNSSPDPANPSVNGGAPAGTLNPAAADRGQDSPDGSGVSNARPSVGVDLNITTPADGKSADDKQQGNPRQ